MAKLFRPKTWPLGVQMCPPLTKAKESPSVDSETSDLMTLITKSEDSELQIPRFYCSPSSGARLGKSILAGLPGPSEKEGFAGVLLGVWR